MSQGFRSDSDSSRPRISANSDARIVAAMDDMFRRTADVEHTRAADTHTWATLIMMAALEGDDVEPFVELARLAGADLVALEHAIEAVDRFVRENVLDCETRDEILRFSRDDVLTLLKLGITI